LKLSVQEAAPPAGWTPASGDWVDETALDREALPSVMRKVLATRLGVSR
jgi:hypothetical protein